MDDSFFGAFLFFLLLIGGAIALFIRSRIKRARRIRQTAEQLQDLTQRVYSLEEALQKLTSAPKPVSTPEPAPAQSKPAQPVPAPVPAHVPTPPPPMPVPKPEVPLVPADMRHEASTAAPGPSQATAPPMFAAEEPSGPSLSERLKSALDLEEVLGTNWLNKIGMVLLVLGVAFLLRNQFKALHAGGKVLLGYAISALILGTGIWFERRDRYRILARAGIGGGWALLFFTTFAMYHIEATRVLFRQDLDLALCLVVAAVMVWHTLHYRSQVVTGLAFLLAFGTVSISHSNVYSLSAGAVLAAGLVVIVGKMQWFELEVFGILASYLNHYLWLRPIIEPMGGHNHPFPEFAASAGILGFYWLVFRLSYVFRRPEGNQERTSTVAALLNTALLLALFKYQSAHPEWAFYALLAIGGIETLLGQLPVARRRRTAVIVLSTLGVVLLIAAFPFKYSEARLSVLWLLEAEALLLVGVWTREIVFRRLGALASLLVAGQMIAVDAAAIFGRRMDDAALQPDFRLAIFFLVAGLVFYANAHWVRRKWDELFAHEFDRRLMHRLSYVGGLMLFISAWLAFPEAWTAVAWCAVGFTLALLGRRLTDRDLVYQANFFAAASVFRVLSTNFGTTEPHRHLFTRLITVSLVSVLLYVTSRWSWAEPGEGDSAGWKRYATAAYTWSGSFLLAGLAWFELHYALSAAVWAVGALVLALLGRRWANRDLAYQANVLAAAAFLRTLAVNYLAADTWHHLTFRFISVLTVAALLYVTCRWSWPPGAEDREFFLGAYPFPRRRWVSGAYMWAAALLLALLAWYELRTVGVAVAWVMGGLILFEIGLSRKILTPRLQAYVLFLAGFARIFYVNLNAEAPGELSPRFYTVVPIALAFFYAYWRLLQHESDLLELEKKIKAAEFCSYLGTISLAALMRFELPADWVAAAWAGLAWALMAVAWRSRRKVFLHQALLVSAGVLFRTVMHNFYERSYFPAPVWQGRFVTVGTVVALLFAALPFAFRLRSKEASTKTGVRRWLQAIGRRPEQIFFFVAVGLLTTLLTLEMRHAMVTLSWGVEGVAIFLIALWATERSFRLTGLGLLLLCVGKILVVDVWKIDDPTARYLTLIVVGAALLFVSWLYTRYREKILRYL